MVLFCIRRLEVRAGRFKQQSLVSQNKIDTQIVIVSYYKNIVMSLIAKLVLGTLYLVGAVKETNVYGAFGDYKTVS